MPWMRRRCDEPCYNTFVTDIKHCKGPGVSSPAFDIDSTSDIPLWIQINREIMNAIEHGDYRAGDKLPSARALASQIGVNYHTVNVAYKRLAQNGILEARQGSGFYVRGVYDTTQSNGHHRLIADATLDYFARCKELGMSLDDILSTVAYTVAFHRVREQDVREQNECETGAGEASAEDANDPEDSDT
jgi:GntR family transcriptional regulator